MRAVSVLLAACALAAKSDPVAELDACAANLEEVKAMVGKAKASAAEAADALDKERAAGKAAGKELDSVEGELADQSSALAAETAKLGKLGDAVEVFGKGLEQRRDALSNRMKALEETESLRNAYSDVVRASETEVAQMRANMPADDIAWAAALELQDAKLTEERERLGALQEQVAGELRDLEQLSQAWQQDKKQFATFKESLEDKLAAKAKLEVAVDSLESESEKLRQEVTDSKAKVDTLHEGAKAAQKKLGAAVDTLVKDQGEALDLLEETLLKCEQDAKDEKAAMKSAHATQLKTEKKDLKDGLEAAHADEMAKTKGAHAEETSGLKDAHAEEKAALEAELHEATAEPTTEERFEQVQENVASGMEGAISEFAKALQEANPPEEKAAEETVTTTTTEGMNDMGEMFGKLHDKLAKPAALHVVTEELADVSTKPAPLKAADANPTHAKRTAKAAKAPADKVAASDDKPRKDGMLRGLVTSRRVSDPAVARRT